MLTHAANFITILPIQNRVKYTRRVIYRSWVRRLTTLAALSSSVSRLLCLLFETFCVQIGQIK